MQPQIACSSLQQVAFGNLSAANKFSSQFIAGASRIKYDKEMNRQRNPYAVSSSGDPTREKSKHGLDFRHVGTLYFNFACGVCIVIAFFSAFAFVTRPAGMSGLNAASEIFRGLWPPVLLLIACVLGYTFFSLLRLRCRWVIANAVPSLTAGILFPILASCTYLIHYALTGNSDVDVGKLPAMMGLVLVLSEFAVVRRVKACGIPTFGDQRLR